MAHRAEQIILLRDSEKAKQNNFRDLWQQVADLMLPRENQINQKSFPGEQKTRFIYDTTAIFASQDMASGLSGSMIPTGQKFFGLTVRDVDLRNNDSVSRYLSQVAEITHQEMFSSNFMLQLNETLRSLAVFGTGNIYTEWDNKTQSLNYRDYVVGTYQIRENNKGIVDTVILTIHLTSRQAMQEFGEENIDRDIKSDLEQAGDKRWEYIQIVRPREDFNSKFKDNKNMPFESLYVDVKNRVVVKESGFDENPFSVARWQKSSGEIYGRGQGTEVLPDVKMLQKMKKDFIELADKIVNPPLMVHETFDGQVRVIPGAQNHVNDMNSIAGIPNSAIGNFPIGEKALELQQAQVNKAFFRDIFVQLSDLTGDRRTTVEITERLREGLRRLASPVMRMQAELFNPVIIRSIFLLMRNGVVPLPPPELENQAFDIEYEGQLSLALKSQQSRGALQTIEFGASIAEIFPEALDNVKIDKVFRDVGRTFGMKEEHLATEDEVQEKRDERQRQQEAAQAAQMAQLAAQGYKDTNQAPEAGSPAQEVMDAIGQ